MEAQINSFRYKMNAWLGAFGEKHVPFFRSKEEQYAGTAGRA